MRREEVAAGCVVGGTLLFIIVFTSVKMLGLWLIVEALR